MLTVAWMNREALAETVEFRPGGVLVALAQEALAQGRGVGHVQKVSEIRLDCDADAYCCRWSRLAALPATQAASAASSAGWKTAVGDADPVLKDPRPDLRKK